MIRGQVQRVIAERHVEKYFLSAYRAVASGAVPPVAAAPPVSAAATAAPEVGGVLPAALVRRSGRRTGTG